MQPNPFIIYWGIPLFCVDSTATLVFSATGGCVVTPMNDLIGTYGESADQMMLIKPFHQKKGKRTDCWNPIYIYNVHSLVHGSTLNFASNNYQTRPDNLLDHQRWPCLCSQGSCIPQIIWAWTAPSCDLNRRRCRSIHLPHVNPFRYFPYVYTKRRSKSVDQTYYIRRFRKERPLEPSTKEYICVDKFQ